MAVKGAVQCGVELACVGLHEGEQARIDQPKLVASADRLRERMNLLTADFLVDVGGQQARRQSAVFRFFSRQQRGRANRQVIQFSCAGPVIQTGDRACRDAHRVHGVQAVAATLHCAHDLVEVYRLTSTIAFGHAHAGWRIGWGE